MPLLSRVALLVAATLVGAACAASVELTVDPSPAPTPTGGSQVTGDPEPAEPGPPTSTPTTAAPTEAPDTSATPTPADASPPDDGAPVPELAYEDAIDTYLSDIEAYWSGTLQRVSGPAFVPVEALTPYDPGQLESIPSCAGELGPLALYEGNAFYCEPDDYIAWDDVGLFPDLYRTYGDFSLGLVLAHEYGHAIQARLDAVGPTVFLELHADCLAGAWAGSVARGERDGVPFERADLDNAIGGFLTFADPRGTIARDPGAHGTAFDRVNAFAEGFERDVDACLQYLVDPPQTASIVIRSDETSGGDLPLVDLLPLLVDDLRQYLDVLGESQVDPDFDPPAPPVEFGTGLGNPPPCAGLQPDADAIEGSAYYCEATDTVHIDRAELEDLWGEVGDFAPAYGIAHSYAMALVVELVDADPTASVLAADCLVGVWARDIFDDMARPVDQRTHDIELSAGDLDEGIVGLVLVPQLGPSLTQPAGLQTFDRVSEFSAGFFRGVSQCPLALGDS